MARRAGAGERAGFRSPAAFRRGRSCFTLRPAIAGADAADIDQMFAAMDADQQRAELSRPSCSSRRSPLHAQRGIWTWSSRRRARIDKARSRAWRRCLPATSGRPIRSTASPPVLEMLDDSGSGRLLPCERAILAAAPCGRRAAACADPRRPSNSRSKAKNTSCSVLLLRQRRLQRRRNPARHCDPAPRSRRRGWRREAMSAAWAMAGKFSVQSRPLRVSSDVVALFDAQLDAIAVELDLMHPARARRRPLFRPAQLRRRRSAAATSPSCYVALARFRWARRDRFSCGCSRSRRRRNFSCA